MLRRFTRWFVTLTIVAHAVSASAADVQKRPFRIGMFRLNRDLDNQKPLAVADSAGYIIRDDSVIGGYDRTKMTSWNFKLNRRNWWSDIDGEVTSTPLLVENTVFISTRGGKVLAINATTGVHLWEVALDSHAERSLIFANGQIYVVTVGQVAYSIEAQSGKRTWVYDAGFPGSVVVRRAPAPIIHDGKLVFGVASGEFVAVKLDDGKVAWRFNPLYLENRFHDSVGDMVVLNGKILVTRYDGLVGLIELEGDHRVVWQDKLTSISTSVFRNGKYYVGLVAGEILAVDSSTGRSNWRTQTATTPAFIVAGETLIYSIGADGRIVAIDQASGEIAWAEDLGGRIASPPIVTEDRMFITTGLRNVYGYKL